VNGLFKYLILAALFLCFISTANAIYTDLNAWDANGVKHANRGEDFNVALPTAQTADVNSDYNYVVVLKYQSIYVDLNVKVIPGTAGAASIDSSSRIDANVETRRLTGTCTGGATRDVNAIIFTKHADLNTFNVTVTVPSSGADINYLVGKEVAVELWPIVDSNYNPTEPWKSTATCGAEADANSMFIIGPAIIIRTPNANSLTAAIDQNITIMGFGFAPWIGQDNNVRISFYDYNGSNRVGTRIDAHTTNNDVNLFDSAHSYSLKYHQGGVGDSNDSVWSQTGDHNWTLDWNGYTVFPDANGEFDVNVTVPYLTTNTIGVSDLNTLRAYSSAKEPATGVTIGDVNASLIITPKITVPGDMNATITISGHYYSISDAMSRNLISNMQAVSGFIVRMGKITDNNTSSMELREVMIWFRDFNMAKGPVRDYTDINSGKVGNGRAEINTTTMPEFAVDANVFFYNVKVPSGAMPVLAKDGIVCPATTCTNLDGTALSASYTDAVQTDIYGNAVKTWKYNPDAGDGNLAFRVSTFSAYEAGTLTVEVVTPNGGEKIRTPRHNADSNYTFSFAFKDLNVQDNNWDAIGTERMQAIIYYSEKGGDKTGVLIKDTNLFDVVGIRCNGWSDMVYSGSTVSDDVNLAKTKTCVFDVNRSDLNKIIGEYVVDVNIIGPWHDTAAHTSSVIGHSDANVFFNPPLIELYDTNLNSANFVINNGLGSCPPMGCQPDINYVVDFNIYLPMDVNVDFNSGLPLSDYNIHFYLGSTQADTLSNDLNAAHKNSAFDVNFGPSGNRKWSTAASSVTNLFSVTPLYIECSQPPVANRYFDYNCQMQWDVNGVLEGKYYLIAKIFNNNGKTVGVGTQNSWVSQTLDVNELWDINATAYSFTVNDDNKPRASSTSGTSTRSSYYDLVLTCDDNTTAISNYLFREAGGSWIDNGTTSTYRFTLSASETLPATKTYEGGCRDYAGNISDINVSKQVTHQSGGGGEEEEEDGGLDGGLPSPTPPPTAGTETVLNQTISNKPTASEIESVLRSAGASDTAIAKASAAVGKTSVARTVKVDKITDSSGVVSYKSTVTIKVTNSGSKRMANVKVIEDIPKSVARSASEISSTATMKVLKEDPIIEFTIDAIRPNSKEEVSYTVDKEIKEGVLNLWIPPITAELEELEPCEGVVCADRDCQVGQCNPTTGRCDYTNKEDGTVCQENKVCEAGSCVEKPAPQAQAVCGNNVCETDLGETVESCAADCAAKQPLDLTTAAIVVVVIIIILGGGAYYYYSVKGRGFQTKGFKPKK